MNAITKSITLSALALSALALTSCHDRCTSCNTDSQTVITRTTTQTAVVDPVYAPTQPVLVSKPAATSRPIVCNTPAVMTQHKPAPNPRIVVCEKPVVLPAPVAMECQPARPIKSNTGWGRNNRNTPTITVNTRNYGRPVNNNTCGL